MSPDAIGKITVAHATVRFGIAGLSHDHAKLILGREPRGDIEIVGIAEADELLRQRYAHTYGLPAELFFEDLASMLDTTEPEAVTAMGSIYEHLAVVEACALRGIHVMVEKPMAVNWDHATAMAVLANEGGIHLLTNYRPTWQASVQAVYTLAVKENCFGQLGNIRVYEGHQGPEEIGCSADFVCFLRDPVRNGGGVITDFGSFGANLVTWLMQGELPLSVTAMFQTVKPDMYPQVDDVATFILTYPHTHAIVEVSWNWPIARSGLEVFGRTGYVQTVDEDTIRVWENEQDKEQVVALAALESPFDDPLAYLVAAMRGEVTVMDTDQVSLTHNLVVTRILDATIQSAQTGRTVTF